MDNQNNWASQENYTNEAIVNSPQELPNDEPWTNQITPKPKKFPLVLSSIAFALLSLALSISGPGVLIAAWLTQPFSWIVSFFYIYIVVGVAIITVISMILYSIAFIWQFSRKSFTYLINMLILLSGNVIGVGMVWLSGYRIIQLHITAAAIILGLCVLLACVGLIILHHFRKKNQNAISGRTFNSIRIAAVIAMLGLIIETGVGIFYLTQLWQEYWPLLQQQKQYEQDQREQYDAAIKENGEMSNQDIGPMAFGLCSGGFDVIHELAGDTGGGIIQCNTGDGDIYEISNRQTKNNGYITAHAIYYGVSKDETLETYFPGTHYLYKNLHNTSYPEEVVLLLQAASIEDVIAKYSEPLYNCIRKKNERYDTDLRFTIFYNEELDDVTTLKDYILLAGTHEIVNDWLPDGNSAIGPTGEEYIFNGVEALNVLDDLGYNPGSYSNQTRNAIKFHPHIFFNITGGSQITLESLRDQMYNSQLCQDGNAMSWTTCSE